MVTTFASSEGRLANSITLSRLVIAGLGVVFRFTFLRLRLIIFVTVRVVVVISPLLLVLRDRSLFLLFRVFRHD